jgi:hypothetical protein
MGTIVQLEQFKAAKSSGTERWKQVTFAAVEKVIEGLQADLAGKDFEQISDQLLKQGQQITGALMAEVLKTVGSKELDRVQYPCPGCGDILYKRSDKSRDVESRHGSINVHRPYFYCGSCAVGYFPFDDAVGLAPQKKQYDLQRAASRLLSQLPYEEAAAIFLELTKVPIANYTIHEIGGRVGAAAKMEAVLPSCAKVKATIEELSGNKTWRPVLAVAADGAHLPTRPETGTRQGKRGPGEYKEAKGFRIYLVGQERIEQIMSWHQIATEEEFGQAIQFAATLVPTNDVRVCLLGDGAPWIWNHLKSAFPMGREVLDYYHCSEHIHKLAELQYPDDKNRRALWIESTMARLFAGDVQAVIWGLQRMLAESAVAAEEIRRLIGYLENNEHRIDYQALRRGQYPLGSGGIGSANKFICHVRMKRSGAWWYKINGNKVLRIRCAYYNGTFDEVFAKYKRLQRGGKKLTPNA